MVTLELKQFLQATSWEEREKMAFFIFFNACYEKLQAAES
jgi:hypothetical protein